MVEIVLMISLIHLEFCINGLVDSFVFVSVSSNDFICGLLDDSLCVLLKCKE